MRKGLYTIVVLLYMAGMAWAVGSGNKIEARDGFYPITWALMNSTGATKEYENPGGKSTYVDCTFTTTGTDDKTVFLQSSKDGISFVNATVGMDIVNSDSDSLGFAGTVIGGPWWQLYTADADFGVLNTVTGTCDFGNAGGRW